MQSVYPTKRLDWRHNSAFPDTAPDTLANAWISSRLPANTFSLRETARASRIESGDGTIVAPFHPQRARLGRPTMLQISAPQLAELLSGIARAQAAMIHGIESAVPGSRASHIAPALQNVAHTRDHPDPTLTDLPVRVLLSYMGRIGPDLEALARELERLIGESASAAQVVQERSSEAGAPTITSEAPDPIDPDDSLDFRDFDTNS